MILGCRHTQCFLRCLLLNIYVANLWLVLYALFEVTQLEAVQ